jgi:Protein of unknown function (DUF3108)
MSALIVTREKRHHNMPSPAVIRSAKRFAVAAPVLISSFAVTQPVSPQVIATSHSRLAAVYSIRFAGIKLGKFEIWSNLNEKSYSMRGKGELKFITGLIFEIKGGTTSTGAVTKNGPQPTSFTFDFKTKKSNGKLAMMFDGNTVAQVTAQPPFVENPKDIPVTAAHVKDVLDPLSALFFSAKTAKLNTDGSVCPGRIPVFDGKQRFDLELSHKKTVQVKKRGKGGYSGPAVVCRIKYIPIAGYKPNNSGIKFMMETDKLEVWLIRVPKKEMYVPYHITIPTPYGTASATSIGLQLEIPGEKKIAVIY